VQGGSEPVLSQQVLLSLLQQLGYDLSREPVTKLNWIKDTAVALDPQVLAADQGRSCMLAYARTCMPCLWAARKPSYTLPELPSGVLDHTWQVPWYVPSDG